jgi:hypothetical protein
MTPKDQKDLPGMEGRGIAELDDLCRSYAKIRDKRQDLTKREVELKADLLAAMRKHKKREYVSDGIEARIVTEEESVKVKVAKAEEEEAEE